LRRGLKVKFAWSRLPEVAVDVRGFA
jgi:hypothetical protein